MRAKRQLTRGWLHAGLAVVAIPSAACAPTVETREPCKSSCVSLASEFRAQCGEPGADGCLRSVDLHERECLGLCEASARH
ncbi:MAG: hypothetical protein CVU63_05075 [Deltaproteobacteria bacterium HGW-Deltaproteobacteria-20]|nr:MAG: hypothetical protein CVU63_05075 [Deltaproteobacteria bacterium HGW-Deltaproteobacteria-20]